ncbi:hypothetical protein [uncultured Methanoculleus sp.]|uniref:hypothetical protein n=1 Tax=uncultured Methanoculleus sp. TaxID=183762 RepID=UPI0032047986
MSPVSRESLYTLARGITNFISGHMLRLTESALAGKTLVGARIALPGRDIHQRLRRHAEHADGAVSRNDVF